MKFITALAIVAALSCAALAAYDVPAVQSSSTAFHKPDKPAIAAPNLRPDVLVLCAFDAPDAIPVPDAEARAPKPISDYRNISTLAVAETVKKKGVASLTARTLAVARSSI